MLTDLHLQAIYDSSELDIIQELFVPVLRHSVKYKRGVGYFTSAWLSLCSQGLVALAENDGKAELITSPYLEEGDWHAFLLGDEAKRNYIIYEKLKEQVNELEKTLSHDATVALAWLIADNILDIKIAIPRNNRGDFHDKFALFEDADKNKIAIHGSFNDSQKSSFNGEGISVFKSWVEGHAEFVVKHEERFDKLFQEKNLYYNIFNIPQAIKDQIVMLRKSNKRPYSNKSEIMALPFNSLPDGITLFPFQEKAMEEWSKADGRGIFEMATGTGKTITSLSCASKLSNEVENLTIIISVPFNHLVDQWNSESIQFGFSPLLCRGNYNQWFNKLKSRIQDINLKTRKNLCIICTHTTGSNDKFIDLITTIKGNVLFIGDEVHYLGSKKYRRLLHYKFDYRIGLSATPNRWFDEDGTAYIKNYFENTIIELSLQNAIQQGFLTPYRFFPHLIELTLYEMDLFENLTDKIKKLSQYTDDMEKVSLVEKYLRDRARIVAKAENKKVVFLDLIDKRIQTVGLNEISHIIVYCAVGETVDIVKSLSKRGLRVHEFVYTVSPERRKEVLKQFDRGDIQILVAIKCLDEGVNIPATREAFFLANTTNPREFVQRRGRILRISKGKQEALLHDFVVIPNSDMPFSEETAEKILRREMPRFAEFADGAKNEFEARDTMYPILKKYDLLPLFDKKPWDLYFENIQRKDNGEDVENGE